MKRNVALLTDQVRNKLSGKCINAIVTEAFINALPFDKKEVVNEASSLSRYSAKVIEKMHPENILDRALESTINDREYHLYIQNLKTNIDEVVESATRRIVNEALLEDTPTPDIIAQAKLNDDETEKLVNASKQSGTDAVAKLVKDKMIQVIKDEKNAYELSAKLRNEVKDVIKSEAEDIKTSEEDDALESYFNLVLAPTDVRNHISVFSKMQDVCMEAILHSTEKYEGEIPYETLEKITLESTFPYFDLSNRSLSEELNSMIIVTESAIECNGEDLEVKKKKIAKTAFICSICIMTLLETLKTMHLAKPTLADVKHFVDDPTSAKNLTNVNLTKINDKVTDVISDSKKYVAMGAYDSTEITQCKESLEHVKNVLSSISVSTEADVNYKNKIVDKIDTALNNMNVTTPGELVNPGYFIARYKNENLTNLEHGVKLVAQKPLVQEVLINVKSDINCTEKRKVNIELKGMDASSKPVAFYTIEIHAIPEFGRTLVDVIKDSANYCDFGPKPVKIHFTDKGYSIPAKG